MAELVEADGGGESEAVRGQGTTQSAQEGEIGRGCLCSPVTVDLHFAHPAVAIVGGAHLLDAIRDALGQGVERGRSGVETGVDDEDHGNDFEAAGNGIAPLQGGNGHRLVGDLIGGDVEIAQIDFADVVAAQKIAVPGGKFQDGAPIINGRCGTRHFGGLTAAARATDKEEAANEDKTRVEAIHNTKVGFRHEMDKPCGGEIGEGGVLCSRSWRNKQIMAENQKNAAHKLLFCAAK